MRILLQLIMLISIIAFCLFLIISILFTALLVHGLQKFHCMLGQLCVMILLCMYFHIAFNCIVLYSRTLKCATVHVLTVVISLNVPQYMC